MCLFFFEILFQGSKVLAYGKILRVKEKLLTFIINSLKTFSPK